jgi:formate--tetrahydrofolate ligase
MLREWIRGISYETLPGLPKLPQALKIDVDEEGNIRGMDY